MKRRAGFLLGSLAICAFLTWQIGVFDGQAAIQQREYTDENANCSFDGVNRCCHDACTLRAKAE